MIGSNQTECECVRDPNRGFWDGENCDKCLSSLMTVVGGCSDCGPHATLNLDEAVSCSCDGGFMEVGGECAIWPVILMCCLTMVCAVGLGFILIKKYES